MKLQKEENSVKKRDVKFDGLRVIGLLAIILAHVNPPALIFQIRNFDVPLMVLVSGAVYGLSSSQKKYFSYIWGRVLRLLTPTWIFLGIFFLLNISLGKYFSLNDVLSSFALLNGIGYVWIIRVFILVAFIAPFFVYLYQKIQNKMIYLLAVVFIFIFYNLLHRVYVLVPFLHTNQFSDFLLQNIIFYMLPFGCVAGLGIYLLNASKKSVVLLFIFSSGIFVFLAHTYSVHAFMPTQAYKYPPGIYYLAYAIAVSLLFYLLSFTRIFHKVFNSRVMLFVSSSSLWIYLWQILFLYLWNYLRNAMSKSFDTYLNEYIIILVVSVFVTYIQKRLMQWIVVRIHNKGIQNTLTLSFLK